MSQRLVFLLATIALTAASGCFTVQADLPGALRGDLDESVEVIGHLDLEVTHSFFLMGLTPDAPEDLFRDQILDEVRKAGGDGIANIVFESYFDFPDYLLSEVSLGIYTPRTYRLRADIVRIHAPRLPGKPLLGAAR